MNKKDLRLAKKKILKCLTEDVKHGRKKSLAIFDKQKGYALFCGTDLDMDKVVLGLYLALMDSDKENSNEHST